MKIRQKAFTEEDRIRIKELLCILCEESWARNGYQKTSVKSLTTKANVSIGTFYSIFESKEILFYETIFNSRKRVRREVEKMITKEPNREGYVKGLKHIFSEYAYNNFLMDLTSPDFKMFAGKLTEEQKKEIYDDDRDYSDYLVDRLELKILVDKEFLFSVLSAMILTINADGKSEVEQIKVFNFILDSIIDDLCEES